MQRREWLAGFAPITLGAAMLATGVRPAASQSSSQSLGPTLERIRATKRLRFGVVASQPPYCWKDPASGAWIGFVVDCARDLAAEHGAEIAPLESTWGNAVLEVQGGKVDIFFGLAPTAQRALAVDFTKPLYDNAFALIARNGFDPRSWDDLNDPAVCVAVELGSAYDQAMSTLCPRATVLRLPSNNDALLAVQSGRADCQVLVVILALSVLARNRALGHLVVPAPQHGSPTAAMVARGADQAWLAAVDDWVSRRRASGWLRATLVTNLGRIGVPEADVPPQLLF